MAEKPKHNEQIDSNQDALREAGLELAAAPEATEFSEAINRVKEASKVRARLEIKSKALTEGQQAVITGALSILSEIEAMEEGELKDTAFFDFKAAYWELILTPEETSLFRDQVDDHLDQLGGEEAPEKLSYDEFLERHGLPKPGELAESVADMLHDPEINFQEFEKEGYRVQLAQNKKRLKLEIRASKDTPGEGPSEHWTRYQNDISEELAKLYIIHDVVEKTETDVERKRGITDYIVLADEYDRFVEPKPGENRPPEAPEVTPLFEKTGLVSAEDLLTKAKELMADAAQDSFEMGVNGYSVVATKTSESLSIKFETTDELEGDESSEWGEYLKEVESTFMEGNLGKMHMNSSPISLTSNETRLTEIVISNEAEGFVAPEPKPGEEGAEPDDILNDDGLIDVEDGDPIPPGAAIRIDGSLPPKDRMGQLQKEMRAAANNGDWGEVITKGVQWVMALFGSGSERIFGTTWDDVVNGLEWPDGLDDGAPSNIAELYELKAGKLSKLKYKNFDAIKTNISNPGDRVAAAALLGVVKDVDVDKPSENHCSGWVDTIARKAGLSSRYTLSKCAMVNPRYSKDRGDSKSTRYRGWRKRATTEKSHIDQIGGLKPGDMVIEYNGNSSTGFHDEIVVDVKGGKMLVASQNRTKGSSGVRSLQWKTINPETIATVTRPGWVGGSSSSAPAIS